MATRKTQNPETEIENNEAQAPVEENNVNPSEELVTVQLFRDEDRYSDDLYVQVNGERILIQRGVPVQIKRKFAEVIDHSMYQDGVTERMLARLSENYEKATAEKTKPE